MISGILFQSLNLKQKLYKITQCVRETENILAEKNVLDLDKIKTYLKYISEDPDKNQLLKAGEIINSYINDIENLMGRKLQIGRLNFCFYELLELIGKTKNEPDFEVHVKQFDSGNTGVVKPPARFRIFAILDNLRSAFNTGSIFRSADCLGTGEIALCGITPHPPSIKLEKTAMGTLNSVPWKYFKETANAVKFYRDSGYKIAAVETVENSIPLFEFEKFENTAFIFGNEEFGITEDVLNLCDQYLQIPLLGVKNSMNVANAFAVVMYEAARKDSLK